jgi:hypothetical protein
MSRHTWIAALLFGICGPVAATDLAAIDRRIKKEPVYTSKSPLYVLLVLGPEARDRVWLVKDGNVLYVDRNGNGDLTEPAKKLVAKKGTSIEGGHEFEADELTIGGTTHYRLSLFFCPLRRLMLREYAQRPDAQAALKKDPQADILAVLRLDVRAPHLKPTGHVTMAAGGFDLNGPLIPAKKAAEAPIVHFGGPLMVTFADQRPALRRNRAMEFILVAGTAGLGAGTFAAIGYDNTIPASAHPKCEILFPPRKAGAEPVKKLFELKERC